MSLIKKANTIALAFLADVWILTELKVILS